MGNKAPTKDMAAQPFGITSTNALLKEWLYSLGVDNTDSLAVEELHREAIAALTKYIRICKRVMDGDLSFGLVSQQLALVKTVCMHLLGMDPSQDANVKQRNDAFQKQSVKHRDMQSLFNHALTFLNAYKASQPRLSLGGRVSSSSSTKTRAIKVYHATWCGACKAFLKTVEKSTHPVIASMQFYDVDQAKRDSSDVLAGQVKYLPTVFIVDGNNAVVKKFEGANTSFDDIQAAAKV